MYICLSLYYILQSQCELNHHMVLTIRYVVCGCRLPTCPPRLEPSLQLVRPKVAMNIPAWFFIDNGGVSFMSPGCSFLSFIRINTTMSTLFVFDGLNLSVILSNNFWIAADHQFPSPFLFSLYFSFCRLCSVTSLDFVATSY